MKVTISSRNSKLGVLIPSVNLPPIITCRKNAPCAKLCYGRRGNFTFPNVKQSAANNLHIYREDPEKYFSQIEAYFSNSLVLFKFFRWHGTGDIVDKRYFEGIVKIANNCPNTKFLCFTKKFEIINEYLLKGNTLPINLKVVFSAWDKDFLVDNPYDLPVTYVNFKNTSNNPKIPDMAIPCTGRCYECQACWSLKNGQSVYFTQH